jgi:hypothetical protein
MALAIF